MTVPVSLVIPLLVRNDHEPCERLKGLSICCGGSGYWARFTDRVTLFSPARMGSVLAASSPPPPSSGGASVVPGLMVPPGFGMPAVSSAMSSADAAPGQQETEDPLPNPGAFDECHRKCKGERRLLGRTLKVYFSLNSKSASCVE